MYYIGNSSDDANKQGYPIQEPYDLYSDIIYPYNSLSFLARQEAVLVESSYLLRFFPIQFDRTSSAGSINFRFLWHRVDILKCSDLAK